MVRSLKILPQHNYYLLFPLKIIISLKTRVHPSCSFNLLRIIPTPVQSHVHQIQKMFMTKTPANYLANLAVDFGAMAFV